MASGNETAFLVAKHLKRTEVCPVVCNLLYITVEVCAIHILAAMPYTYEIEGARVGCPAKVIYVRVECLCNVFLITIREGVDAEAVAVRLVTVALHAKPRYKSAVW